MLKRLVLSLTALALALAMVAPAAFAGNGGKEKLRKAVEQTRQACSKAQDSSAKPGKAHRKQCGKSAKKLLAALKQAEQRVQKLQEKLAQAVEDRCGATASGDAARCDKLRQRLERLATLETKLRVAIEKLESRSGKAGETSNPDAQVPEEEIESVEELAQELADSGN